MLQKFEVRGVHTTIDDDLSKYVQKKIGRLDRYLSRPVRESAHGEVSLKEDKSKDKRRSTCEVTLHLPHEVINLSETNLNMYAAVDIVESKLKLRLKKYKELHASGKMHRRLYARLRGQQV